MKQVFLIRNEATGEYFPAGSVEAATKLAVDKNMADVGHPRFELIDCQTCEILGHLYRKFGSDWDLKNCWRLEPSY